MAAVTRRRKRGRVKKLKVRRFPLSATLPFVPVDLFWFNFGISICSSLCLCNRYPQSPVVATEHVYFLAWIKVVEVSRSRQERKDTPCLDFLLAPRIIQEVSSCCRIIQEQPRCQHLCGNGVLYLCLKHLVPALSRCSLI
ncbi:unnamed protein product [Urochloa humidicola]